MDDKDFRILVELFRDPLATHTKLGRAASVAATSAERRLLAMQEDLVLAGYFALPAAEIFDREAFIATATPLLSENLFPVKLLAENDVVWVVRKHDGTITMCLYLPKGSDPSAAGLRREAGWSVSRGPRGPDEKHLAISEADARIMDALIEQPRAEISDLARRTGLPARTVTDRRDHLIKKRMFVVRPAILLRQGPGTVLFTLHVKLSTKEGAPKVREAVDRGLVIQEIDDPPTLVFLTRAYTIPGVYDMQARIAQLKEAREVSFTIYREAAVAHDRLHAWVAEAAAKARVAPSRK